jgi:XisI protein
MDKLGKYRQIIETTIDRFYRINDRQVTIDRSVESSDRLAFDLDRDQYLWFRFGWQEKKKI